MHMSAAAMAVCALVLMSVLVMAVRTLVHMSAAAMAARALVPMSVAMSGPEARHGAQQVRQDMHGRLRQQHQPTEDVHLLVLVQEPVDVQREA